MTRAAAGCVSVCRPARPVFTILRQNPAGATAYELLCAGVMRSPVPGFAFALVLATLAGCDGTVSTASPVADAADATDAADASADATSDTSAPDAARPFAVDDGVERVTIAHANLGSVAGCYPRFRTVEYVRATRTMTWPGCTAPDGGAPSTGYPASTRDLTAAEGAAVESALRAIDYEENPPCSSYDGSEYFMVTTGSDGGSRRYSADNVSCYGYPRAPKIADAYAVLDALPK